MHKVRKKKNYVKVCLQCHVEFHCSTMLKKYCSRGCSKATQRLPVEEKIARANARWLQDKPKRKGVAFTVSHRRPQFEDCA